MGRRGGVAMLVLLAALGSCSDGADPPLIPEAEGTWVGTLTTYMDPLLCGYDAGEGLPPSKSFEHTIEMSGAKVTLRDQAGREYEGDAISSDSFRVYWRDPTSNGIDEYGISVFYSDIHDGTATVDVHYYYSRPAYGCYTSYPGHMSKKLPDQPL